LIFKWLLRTELHFGTVSARRPKWLAEPSSVEGTLEHRCQMMPLAFDEAPSGLSSFLLDVVR
jgi:hypothetical protein